MEINWQEQLQPIVQKYGKQKHPLNYTNLYQLVVMVILSAQDSDKHINELGRDFFNTYPTINALSGATPEDLHRIISSVRNFGNKAKWLVTLAQKTGDDDNIPTTLHELIRLPGIGRKSANVIVRESGGKAEGIIVDLHVLRVAPRLGIVKEEEKPKPEKMEKQLMKVVSPEIWNDTGMAISFLGREICRPSKPACNLCPMNTVCRYYTKGRG